MSKGSFKKATERRKVLAIPYKVKGADGEVITKYRIVPAKGGLA